MKKMFTATLAAALLMISGVSLADADPASCKTRCDSTRLTCNQRDAHSIKCGNAYRACMDICDPTAKAENPVTSCKQHCEDSGLQCGIANGNTPACTSGRDACLVRCGDK